MTKVSLLTEIKEEKISSTTSFSGSDRKENRHTARLLDQIHFPALMIWPQNFWGCHLAAAQGSQHWAP